MREGDEWELFCPADLAYGDRGSGRFIKPASVTFRASPSSASRDARVRPSTRGVCIYSIQFNSIQFISMNARDACIRSVFPLRLFRINRAITSTIVRAIDDRMRGNPLPTRTDRRPRPRSVETKPPPDAYKKPPASRPHVHPFPPANRCRPRVGPRVYPLCVQSCDPHQACTPGTHQPRTPPHAPVQDPSIGTRPRPTRGERARPPPTTQKTKKKKRAPSPLHKCKNKHPRGRATSYSTHPRVRPITSRTRVRDG